MSEFIVEVIKVGPVVNHFNADRLAIAKAYDYDAVIGKDYLKEGDLAVYIQEGAIVTPEIMTKLGGIKLAGANGNRVKATKIRGVLSQGLLLSIPDAEACIVGELSQRPVPWDEGLDVTDILGLRKWDPEIDGIGDPNRVKMMSADAYYCPDKVVHFDVENIKKVRKLFTPGEEVTVTEKIHGTYCQINIFADGDIVITSKGLAGKGQAIAITKESEESNLYLKVGLPIARAFLANYLDVVKSVEGITFQGEIYGKGIQDLDYGQTVSVFACFSVSSGINGELDQRVAHLLCRAFGIPFVPVLGTFAFDPEAIEKLAAEPSFFGNNRLREGVVISAVSDPSMRAKFINPAYLLRKNATEFN